MAISPSWVKKSPSGVVSRAGLGDLGKKIKRKMEKMSKKMGGRAGRRVPP